MSTDRHEPGAAALRAFASGPSVSFHDFHAAWIDAVEGGLAASCDEGGVVERMGRFHLGTGGKRLRALLPGWVCHNLGGDPARALDPGVGLELLHNATLIHDDVQDRDEVRRGHPTVWRRWGDAQAINAGDALYFQAIGVIARARGLSAPEILRCIQIASDALLRVISGQAMEFQLQRPPGDPEHLAPSLASYEQMARGKTAALFAACMGTGAVVAGASDGDVEGAMALGETLGLLFQVQDDYLDLVGEKGRERAGSDLAEGKLSFPVLWAYDHADEAVAARLTAIVDAPRDQTSDGMIVEGIALLRDCGALDATGRWLSASARQVDAHPLSPAVPGLCAQILRPVAHALAALR